MAVGTRAWGNKRNGAASPTLVIDDNLQGRKDQTLGIQVDASTVRVPGAWRPMLLAHGVKTVRQLLNAMQFVAFEFARKVEVDESAVAEARQRVRENLADATKDKSWTAKPRRGKYGYGVLPPPECD